MKCSARRKSWLPSQPFLLNFAHDDILPAVIGSPLTRKTILPLRILKRSSDHSAKTLRCTQNPCAPPIVGFAFPFARPKAGRLCQHPRRRSGDCPARMPRCTRRTCRDSIARSPWQFAHPRGERFCQRPQEAIRRPSGENATLLTISVCP
jgi:hypothetical protein